MENVNSAWLTCQAGVGSAGQTWALLDPGADHSGPAARGHRGLGLGRGSEPWAGRRAGAGLGSQAWGYPAGRGRHFGWDQGRDGSLLPDQMARMLNY